MTDKQLQDALLQVEMNNLYEISLGNTLVTLLVIALVLFALFPLLQFLFPLLYRPFAHSDTRNTGLIREYLWFVDVFMQPRQVFAYRGNLCLMYVVFYNKMTTLFLSIALIAFLFLIPIYMLGTDQSFNLRYQTIWSQMSMQHVEEGSAQMIFPLTCLVIIPLCVMVFYRDFVIVYSEYRQKCLKRVIPQNFVVMVSNFPKGVNTQESLQRAIKNIQKGVRQIVMTPPSSFYLTFLQKRLSNVNYDLQNARLRYYSVYCRFYKFYTQQNAKSAEKMYWQLYDLRSDIKQMNLKKFKLYSRIMGYLYRCKFIKNIDTSKKKALPQITESYYLAEPDKPTSAMRHLQYNELYDIPDYLRKDMGISRYLSQYVLQTSREQIGKSVFLVCESYQEAAEKCNVLLAKDSECPKVAIASTPEDIIWHNVGLSRWITLLRQLVFWALVIGLFVVYTLVQSIIMRALNDNASGWTVALDRAFCSGKCQNELATKCMRCYKTNQSIITFIPAIVNAIMMELLPELLTFCLMILGLTSQQQADYLQFGIFFFFLVTIQGILQVALPTVISPESGNLAADQLLNITISDFMLSLGRNLPNQVFVFINYILGNYFIIPLIGLINLRGIFWMIVHKIASSSKTDFILRYSKAVQFEYGEYLAQIAHVFVIGLMFGIISPFTLLIILLTFAMMVITDRYYLLYITPTTQENELKPQATLLKSVASCIYIGLYFLLIGMYSYLKLFEGNYYIRGGYLCLVMLIVVIIYKIIIDKRYIRSAMELALGEFQEGAGARTIRSNGWFIRLLHRMSVNDLPVSFQNELGHSIVLNDDIVKYYELTDLDAKQVARQYLHPALQQDYYL